MARGGGSSVGSELALEAFELPLHERLTELARTCDRFLDPDLPVPGIVDPDAEAAADTIEQMSDEQLRSALGRGLVIDMDDTLNSNVPLFHHARWQLIPIYAELAGREDLEQIMHEREQVCTRLLPSLGYTPERWRRACETYLDETVPGASEADRQRVMAAAEVALGDGDLFAGVERTLARLQRAGVPMLLLTKGEQEIQNRKIRTHGLARYFGEHIQVVDHKDSRVLDEAIKAAGMSDPIVIGDSAASDIAPATELGLASVHVDRGGGATWGAEHHEVGHSALKAPSFPEAVAMLAR